MRLANLVENQHRSPLFGPLVRTDGCTGAAPSLPQPIADAPDGLDDDRPRTMRDTLGKPLLIPDLAVDPSACADCFESRPRLLVFILSGDGGASGVYDHFESMNFPRYRTQTWLAAWRR
jgi:hypothetical protein